MSAKVPKLFNKWSYDGVKSNEIALQSHIEKKATYVPHTSGRWQKRRFLKARIPIVERLTNGLMFKGRGNGRKLQASRLVRQTLEIIHLQTDANPIQIVINAVSQGAPREDSTRVGSGGVVRRQAVDVSPMRRVNEAIYMMCKGARESAFRNLKTLPECLADEIVNASNGSANSYAIKKKDEVERVAKANR
ncbi:small subunit ribosomal protein S5e [Strigomonas culicis]|nr:small subunit ribosomal protein S5e [Strigomonas culicis]EPY28600.1 small subunit ribosomal protein S5e [Strigomonas culicis]EPY36598.1 small subunit ribosomal protein S5e [Strigomonas culicis]|eukprot:EPY19382.1 small subunit ribosomal protein S5e [Strigomonas culicis]